MEFKIFKKERNLIYGVSDVSFGSMKDGKENLWNFKKGAEFLRSLGEENIGWKNLVWAENVFGSRVHICEKKNSGKVIKNVDGLISNISEQILVVGSADCLPILLYDPKKRVVAGLHGARECLTKGIIKNALDKMTSRFGSNPGEILVAIGPHIRKCHYWLKEKTYQKIKDAKFKNYFLKKKNKVYMDLTKLAIVQLLESDVRKKNIEDSKICTFCSNQKYFSARKKEESPAVYSEKNPCFASFIGLKREK